MNPRKILILILKLSIIGYMLDFNRLSFLYKGIKLFGRINVYYGDILTLFFLFFIILSIFQKDKISLPFINYFAVFYMVSIVAFIYGITKYNIINAIRDSSYVFYSLIFFASYHFIRTLKEINSIFKWLIIGTIILLFIKIILIFENPERVIWFSPVHLYIIGAFFVLFISIRKVHSLWPKTLIIILLLVIGIFIASSGIRTSLLSLVVGVLILIMYTPLKRKIKYSIITILICFIAYSLLQSEYFPRAYFPRAIEKYSSALKLKDDITLNIRLQMWRTALNDVKASPLLGNGFGKISKWDVVADKTKLVTAGGMVFHNSFIHVAYSSGLLGLFALLLIFWKYFKVIHKKFRKSNSEIKRQYLLTCMVIFLVLIVTCCFDVGLSMFHQAFFGWLFMGIGLRLANFDDQVYEKD